MSDIRDSPKVSYEPQLIRDINEMVSPEVQKRFTFYESLFSLCEQNFEEVLKQSITMTKEDKICTPQFIVMLLVQITLTRTRQTSLYQDLIKYISSLSSNMKNFLRRYSLGDDCRANVLIHCNIFTPDELGFDPEIWKEHHIKYKTDLHVIIEEDNIDKLQEHFLRHSFNLPTFFIKSQYAYKDVAPIDFCAFHGSIKCFKYLALNEIPLTNDTCDYAIEGGNTEIIHILEQKGLNFEKCYSIALSSFHNDIADWILIHNQKAYCQPIVALKYFNEQAFAFLLNKEKIHGFHTIKTSPQNMLKFLELNHPHLVPLYLTHVKCKDETR